MRDGQRCWFVPLREVSLISSEGNYVRLHWGQERPLLGRSLAALEEKLDPKRFFRANRRQLINLGHIAQVELGEGGRLHCVVCATDRRSKSRVARHGCFARWSRLVPTAL